MGPDVTERNYPKWPHETSAEREKPANLWLGLSDVYAGNRASDDQSLDFASPLEDRVDLRVAMPAFHGILAHVSVAAEDLDRLFGDLDRRLAGVELGHGSLAVEEGLARGGHPRGPPHQKPRSVDVHLHVGELEGDALVLDDGPTELLAFLGVVERVLVGGARDAQRLGADGRSRRLEGGHRGLARRLLALAHPGQLLVELFLAPEQVGRRHAALLEHDLGRVAGADAHLLELLAHADARGALGHDEGGLAAGPQLGVDRRDDDVQVRDAPVGDPGLGAVEDPLVALLVVESARAQRRDVAASVGLADPEGRELDVVERPVALGDPLHLLLGRAVGHDRRDGQGRAHEGHADPGVAPGELFERQHHRQPRGVDVGVGDEVHAVDADLGGLCDDGPRRLLALVPLVRGRAHHVQRESVDPLLQRFLVVVEFHREVGHRVTFEVRPTPRGRSGYPQVTMKKNRSNDGRIKQPPPEGGGWYGSSLG